MEFNLKHNKHSVGQNAYHLVWKTKFSAQIFNSESYRKVCEGAIKLIAVQYDITIIEFKVMPDHVYLVVDIPSTMTVAKTLQLFKGISSRILRRTFRFLAQHEHLWSPGKFFRSIGNVTADVVENYISYSQGSYRIPDNKLPAYYRQQKLSAFA